MGLPAEVGCSLGFVLAAMTALACTGGGEQCGTCGSGRDGSIHAMDGAGTGGHSPETGGAGTGGNDATGIAGIGSAGASGRGGTIATAGTTGTTGTTGTAGTTGAAGTIGTAGTTGAGGTSAAAGTGGPAGTTGTAGMTGAAGTMGGAGVTGTSGTTGSSGTTGTAGATGGRGGAMAGASGSSGTGGAPIDPDLVLWYKFDDTSGMNAADSSGNGHNGTLTNVGSGSAAFSTTSRVPPGSLNLTSSSSTAGGYVNVPASLQTMGATTAVTISTWVYVRTARPWARILDFNNSRNTGYMLLTAQQESPDSPRFAITATTNDAEQAITMTTPAALSTGAWHHLAVVLAAGATYTGTLYIDKFAVGSNNAMTLRPSTLGNTANNFIGRSAFSSNPYLDGYIDDFRIYKRALTPAEITALP